MPEAPDREITRLRRAIRDVVALSAIPAAWVGREPQDIAAGLADVLVGSLHVDFAFVRLCDSSGESTVEVTRGDAWPAFPEWLQGHLACGRSSSRTTVVPDVGRGASCRGVVICNGVNGEAGLVAAACGRADFPTESDQLLLSIAANHAATAFQNAQLINERRRAEEELRQVRDGLELKVAERTAELQRLYSNLQARELKFRRLVDSNVIGVAITDGEGRIIEANDALLDIIGYTSHDLVSSRLLWMELTPPEWAPASQRAGAQIAETGRCQPFEKEYWRKDGSRVPVMVGVAALEGEGGAMIAFVLDLTERKRSEDALRKMQADLAHVTRVMTMSAIGSSIAHELRQPLSAIMVNADACLRLLRADTLNIEEARECARDILENTNRAGQIIARIRGLMLKGEPEKSPLSINELIHDTLSLTRTELWQQRISVEIELQDNLPAVVGDRVQLQQVLLNLTLNSIDAMSAVDDRPRRLTIRSLAGDHGMIAAEVADTGVGIPPERADQIFEPFNSTKPSGLGMGLSVSRAIIHAHGGRLWATQNGGPGATVHFTLPPAS
jgi:PAS domain S-box-containing protein